MEIEKSKETKFIQIDDNDEFELAYQASLLNKKMADYYQHFFPAEEFY